MPTIGIDAVHLSRNGKGLSRFEGCFMAELARRQDGAEFVVFLDADESLPDLPQAAHVRYVRARKRSLIAWEQVQIPLLCRRHHVDLLQSWSDRLPLLFREPVVSYVFEIPDYRHRARRRSTAYQRWSNQMTQRLFPYSTRKAGHLLVSSHSTRRDLVERYRVPVTKISVLYPGPAAFFRECPDEATTQEIRASLGASAGYVLHFSSTADPRDNTETALRAFSAASRRLHGETKLVIGGRCDLAAQGLSGLVSELGLGKRLILTGFVPDTRLAELYWGADVYLDPSLYEGFGYQVLEAMACGTPVVCSNVTSLPEVAGNAGILADPMDVDGLAAGLVRVLASEAERLEMRRRGLAQARCFTWESTVQGALRAYEEVLGCA